MKTLVLFYSLEGNTKYIAEIIAKELHADMLELKTKKPFPSSGFKKYLFGGKSIIFKEQPELINGEIDLHPYDNIVIGTPIWVSTFAAPWNTFVKRYNCMGKKIALFSCNGGGTSEKCFENFKKSLTNNCFVGEIDFFEPLKNDKEASSQKAIQWAKSLVF